MLPAVPDKDFGCPLKQVVAFDLPHSGTLDRARVGAGWREHCPGSLFIVHIAVAFMASILLTLLQHAVLVMRVVLIFKSVFERAR